MSQNYVGFCKQVYESPGVSNKGMKPSGKAGNISTMSNTVKHTWLEAPNGLCMILVAELMSNV